MNQGKRQKEKGKREVVFLKKTSTLLPFTLYLFPFLFFISPLFAQGMLPPKTNTAANVPPPAPPPTYLLIGQSVRDDVWVMDQTGKLRTLNSYRAPVNILVLFFLSPHCSYDQLAMKDLKIFYDFYKGWNVDFLAVDSTADENLSTMTAMLQQAHMPILVVRDQNQQVARLLHVNATPDVVILDEDSKVQYRGPLHDQMKSAPTLKSKGFAYTAMNTLIGHTDVVPTPEPDAFIGCPLQ